jgi:hypothetical protein
MKTFVYHVPTADPISTLSQPSASLPYLPYPDGSPPAA